MNVTKIPMNEDTKKKITFVRDKLKANGVDIYAMKDHEKGHEMFNELFKEYRSGEHSLSKPNMYALYIAMGADLSIVEVWQDVQDQFEAVRAYNDPHGPAEKVCICGQHELVWTHYMLNEKGKFLVGSNCIYKHAIKEQSEQILEYDRVARNLRAKKKRDIIKAEERKKEREEMMEREAERERENQIYLARRIVQEEQERLWKAEQKRKYDEMMAPIWKKEEEERKERFRIEAELQRQRDDEELLRIKEKHDRHRRQLEAKRQRMEREEMDAEAKRQRKVDKYNNRTPLQIWQDLRHQYYLDNIDPSAGYVPEWKLYDEFENKFPAPK